MKNYEVKAIINFNDIEEKDQNGNDTYRAIGTTWKCTKERYEYLKSKNAVDLVSIDEETTEAEVTAETEETTEEKPKRKRTKKAIENEK